MEPDSDADSAGLQGSEAELGEKLLAHPCDK